MRTVRTKIYRFNELDKQAKERVIGEFTKPLSHSILYYEMRRKGKLTDIEIETIMMSDFPIKYEFTQDGRRF